MLYEVITMVQLHLAVMRVTAETGPFADVVALEVRAGRQNDVGELGIALVPDALRHHELEIRVPEHVDVAVGARHRAAERAAVLIEHVYR